MKILVTGISGQLGFDVARLLREAGEEVTGAGRSAFDLTDESAAGRFITGCAPDAVIHCAAYTAVDKAEEEPELCRRVNVLGTRYIARACRRIGCKLLYVSTDYVFPGEGSACYETDDPKGPLNVYGRTKLEGEAEAEAAARSFIVRTSWVYGKNGNNFVKTMLRLAKEREEIAVIHDQIGSPTYTADLAALICGIIRTEKYGIYHATNEGFCSWAEFSEKIFEMSGEKAKVKRIKTEEYPAKAARPHNSRLSKRSLDQAGFMRLPDWEDALRRFLEEIYSKNL